ncbi:MAG: AarF/UbiB family protein, partial [Gammaproteobacteria bacterium]|nr:AarF/UbiB family protein [Gammaproteobacteria bacterium]
MRRRLLRIARIAARHRLDAVLPADALLENELPVAARLLLKAWPGRWVPARGDGPAGRLRLFFEELGPVFIKFGQLLSTRRDLLPADFADELAKLQDHVPPFPGAEARTIVEAALGDLFGARIERFEEEPLASASIAQVHGAILDDGEEVVVKVVRPGLERVIRDDLDVLMWLAGWIDRHVVASRRLHLPEVAEDHATVVLGELDMISEAANTQRLRDNFAGSPLLYVPRVHHDLTRP